MSSYYENIDYLKSSFVKMVTIGRSAEIAKAMEEVTDALTELVELKRTKVRIEAEKKIVQRKGSNSTPLKSKIEDYETRRDPAWRKAEEVLRRIGVLMK